MKANVNEQLEVLVRRVALIAKAAVAAGTVYASTPTTVVPPANLPALAWQTGDATFLKESIDGGLMLYIEQNPGARLITFDVTDPPSIKSNGSVRFRASRTFDLVASLALDFGAVDPVFTYELNRMFDVKQVRVQMTRTDTGTSSVLAEGGL
jgi:hypothetical protein